VLAPQVHIIVCLSMSLLLLFHILKSMTHTLSHLPS
jgi:hypothetical protein